MQKTFIKGYVTKSAEGKYKVLASTSAIDRQGDSIDQNGWDLVNFLKNPVMPWAHKYDELPVAKVTSIGVTDQGLEAEFEFAPAEGNPKAQQIKTLYDEGYLNAVSVGFIPKERNGKTITKAELLEISIVPVPANQEALRLAIKSLDISEIPEVKGAVSEELDAEKIWEEKYRLYSEVCEVLGAFAKTFFDENTPVTDFSKLLDEAIGLMQEVSTANVSADEGGEEETETEETQEEGEKTLKVKSARVPLSVEMMKYLDLHITKSGRTLSKKTLEKMQEAIESMKGATTVLEELKAASSEDQDGNGDSSTDEEETKEVEKEAVVTLSLDEARQLRQSLIVNDKSNELTLGILNAHLRAKGALQ